MNLKKYAEKNGITLDEAKEKTGLTHWNQTVSEDPGDIGEEVVVESSITSTVVDLKKSSTQERVPPEITKEEVFSIFILGNKSPYWNK